MGVLEQLRFRGRQLRARIPESVSRRVPRKISPARALSLAMMVAGAVLVIYVATQYGSMYHEQQQLRAKFQQQNSQPHASGAKPVKADDGLIRLSIPKINLDAIVVEGTTRRKLLVGPGHLKETALPGQFGNSVISAHRDTFFRHIYELNKGDVIEVQRAGETYRYEVTGKKIVDPSDISVIRQTKNPQLTLITCYPTYYIGPAPERLVVFSKLVDPKPESIEHVESAAAAVGKSY
jgi:sortase A